MEVRSLSSLDAETWLPTATPEFLLTRNPAPGVLFSSRSISTSSLEFYGVDLLPLVASWPDAELSLFTVLPEDLAELLVVDDPGFC